MVGLKSRTVDVLRKSRGGDCVGKKRISHRPSTIATLIEMIGRWRANKTKSWTDNKEDGLVTVSPPICLPFFICYCAQRYWSPELRARLVTNAIAVVERSPGV